MAYILGEKLSQLESLRLIRYMGVTRCTSLLENDGPLLGVEKIIERLLKADPELTKQEAEANLPKLLKRSFHPYIDKHVYCRFSKSIDPETEEEKYHIKHCYDYPPLRTILTQEKKDIA